MPEIVGVDVTVALGPGLLVEVPHDAVAVVADDPGGDVGGDLELTGELDPVADMPPDHLRRLLGGEEVVWVLDAELVLDEHGRVLRLPQVVVVGHGPGEQCVGPDRPGGPMGQSPHHQRVVEGPERLLLEELERLVVAVGEVEEAETGRDVEGRLEELQGGQTHQ